MKISGDYHMHTTYSDGRASVIDMVHRAKELGLSEIAITDHGFALRSGIKRDKLDYLKTDIDAARAQVPELPILFGIESNLTDTDGTIDVDAETRGKLDLLLFGIHLNVKYTARAIFTFLIPNLFYLAIRRTPPWRVKKNTAIVKATIENNKIDIWVHPSRYARVDVVEIAKTCAERGTLVELNGKKISFRPIDFERMLAVGARFIINSDAHDPRRIAEVDRVFEFLKNCDYNESDIVNLNQTLTEYKNELSGRNQKGTEQPGREAFPLSASPSKRPWFRRFSKKRSS